MTYQLVNGDCLEVLKTLADASVDAVVTDPPYELGFMQKKWDASGIAYKVELWRECLRVLKPGGHLLAFGGTRTYHRMACAIEDAGFEIRDSLHWIYGSGFPKSLDVSKAIDKAAGAEREVVGHEVNWGASKAEDGKAAYGDYAGGWDITAPATDAAKEWSGWGTALKPAHEPVVVARKPLVGTVAANVLEHGTGALNIDGCRVVRGVDDASGWSKTGSRESENRAMDNKNYSRPAKPDAAGRWPPNILLSHTPECRDACAEDCPVGEMDRQSGTLKSGSRKEGVYKTQGYMGGNANPMPAVIGDSGGASRFFPVFRPDENGCAPDCPVAEIDRQSGFLHASGNKKDTGAGKDANYDASSFHVSYQGRALRDYQDGGGGASRFFPVFRYQAKASRSERGVYLTCDCEAGTIPAWVNEVRSRLEKMGVTSPAKVTCAETTTGSSDCSTPLCGNERTDLSPQDGKSTTSTRTNSTIDWKTSDSLQQPNINAFTEGANCATAFGSSLAVSAESLSLSTQTTSTSRNKVGRCTGVAAPATYALLWSGKRCETCGSEVKGRGHETVKPVALMAWLVKLVTPPGGTVLDPFMGSGTTGVAATQEGFGFIGIEREPEYFRICEARVASAVPEQPEQKELFG